MLSSEEVQGATPEQARKMLAEISGVLPLLVAKASEQISILPPDQLLTVEEVATSLRISEDEVRRNAKLKKYPFAYQDRPGARWKFSRNGRDEYLRSMVAR